MSQVEPEAHTVELPPVEAPYTPPNRHSKPPSHGRRNYKGAFIGSITGLVALLAAGGGATYWFGFRKSTAAAASCGLDGTWLWTYTNFVGSFTLTGNPPQGESLAKHLMADGTVNSDPGTIRLTLHGNQISGISYGSPQDNYVAGASQPLSVTGTLNSCNNMTLQYNGGTSSSITTSQPIIRATQSEVRQAIIDLEDGNAAASTTSTTYVPPPSYTTTTQGTYSAATGVVLGQNVNPSPMSAVVQKRLGYFYESINSGNYTAAYNMFTQADQQALGSESNWANSISGSQYSNVTIQNISGQESRPMTVEVTFQTTQGNTCDDWDLIYTLKYSGGMYLIDSAKPTSGSGSTSC